VLLLSLCFFFSASLAQQPAKRRAQFIWDGGYLRITSVDFHPPNKNQAAEPELSKR
jgi:hypothetical protein